jgi:hypothetical protein
MARASALISIFPSLTGRKKRGDHDMHPEEILERLPYRLLGQWLLSVQLPATVTRASSLSSNMKSWVRICKPSKETRNWFPAWWTGIRQPYLSYRPARLHRLADSINRNRFLASLNIYKYGLRSSTQCTMSSPDTLFISSAAYTNSNPERQDGHLAHTLLRMLFTDQKKRVLPQFNDHFCNLWCGGKYPAGTRLTTWSYTFRFTKLRFTSKYEEDICLYEKKHI